MHPADIKAALAKKGITLISLAAEHNIPRDTISEALRRGRPNAEKIIADTLSTTPQKLFPNRFHPDGSRKNKRLDRAAKRKSLTRDNNTKGVCAASANNAGAA